MYPRLILCASEQPFMTMRLTVTSSKAGLNAADDDGMVDILQVQGQILAKLASSNARGWLCIRTIGQSPSYDLSDRDLLAATRLASAILWLTITNWLNLGRY